MEGDERNEGQMTSVNVEIEQNGQKGTEHNVYIMSLPPVVCKQK